MMAREGDLIETFDGNIFDVKGLVHPSERIIAFIRFTHDPEGERKSGSATYRKVYPLHERYALLREGFPQYLVHDLVFNELLCEVPIQAIKGHYKPSEYLRKLRQKRRIGQLEAEAVQFAELLKRNAKIPWNKLGVSGSLLIGLDTPRSDIDIVVYGSPSCQRVYNALKSLVKEKDGSVKSYNTEELKHLFDFRSKDTAIQFEDFVATESRKVLQGKFNGRDYYIRCIKDWEEMDEQYGTVNYQSLGYAKIKAKIADDCQRIFTPCHYRIDDVETVEGLKIESIEEIVSFRGRFCEQARNGETIIAQGKIELIQKRDGHKYHQMVLGNKVTDYMILA